MIKGIDVSEHNENIDFAKVKNAGYNFVIIRIGWIGNKNNHTVDKYFEENYRKAKEQGLKIGFYVYSYVENETAMYSAINWIKQKILGKTYEYPIFLDMEDKQIANLSKELLTNLCIAFCNSFKNSGVYANLDWFTNKLDVNKLTNYKIWLAQWSSNYTKDFKVDLWQYTSKGKVDGIKGNVDLNYCLNCKDNVNIEEITGEIIGGDFEVKTWQNGSTNETVYSDLSCTNKIGTIYPREYAECYGIIDEKYLVVYYITNSSGQVTGRKAGFVKYNGGVK